MSTTITAGLRIDTSAAYKDIDVFKSRINKSFSQPLGRISGDAAEFSKSLQAAAARVTAFGATTGSIYLVTKAISETARATIEVNKQLTELNTFLGESESKLQNFSKTLFSIARNTGSTFSDATEAAKEFARQGLSTEETLNRTNDALILSRISGLNYAQSVNSITTALNGFGKEALTSTDIINKLIAVDTRFAVSSKDLSEALTRVGSAAEEAGLSSDQLVATITTAQQITGRGGAVIGNALKTIFTRVRRPEILDQLKQIGVVVTDQNGSLLNAIDILKNYTNVTKNLSQAEKSRTAELLGGVYQINQLQSVIRDLGSANSIYASSLKISIGATDEAIKKNSELNKSYAALINDTANLATQVGSDIGKSLFGPIISGGAGVTKAILEFLSPESILPQIGKTGQEIGKSLSREIGKGVLDTLGNALVFVGAPIAAVVGASIGSRLLKFLTASVQTQIKGITDPLGRVATGGSYSGNKEREQLNLQNQISDVVKKNNFIGEATVKGVYNEGKARREVLKEILSANIQLERQANLAQTIFNTISKIKPTVTTIGQVNSFGLNQVNPRRNAKGRFIASGYIPNFSMGLAEQEESAAKGFGAKNPKARLIRATIKGKTGPVMINDEEDVVPNFAGTGETAIIPRYRNVKDIPRMAKGYVPNFAQEISSAGTSQNQVPGLFTKFGAELGPRNIDIGGGKYNKGTNFLKKNFGILSRVHDKYNRSAKFNDKTLKELYGSADTATVANVLNVIKEKSAREELLEFVSKSIKPTGSAYFSIWEKDKTGIGVITPRGYQNNLPTDAYLEEISKYFNITKKTGNYIVGSPISKASGYIPNFNHAKGRLPEGISGSMATFYDLNRKFGNLNIGKKVFKEQFPEDIKKQAIAREFLAARELLNLERSGLVSPIWKSPELIGTLQRSLERKSIGKEAMVGYKTQADLVDSLPNEFARNNLRSLFRLTNASLYDQVSTSQIGVRDLNPHNVMVNPQGQKIFTDIASSENFSKHQGKILFSQNSDSKANLLLRRIARRGARLSVVDPGEFSLESPALSREFAESLRDGRASGYIPNFAKRRDVIQRIGKKEIFARFQKHFEAGKDYQGFYNIHGEEFNNRKLTAQEAKIYANITSAISPSVPDYVAAQFAAPIFNRFMQTRSTNVEDYFDLAPSKIVSRHKNVASLGLFGLAGTLSKKGKIRARDDVRRSGLSKALRGVDLGSDDTAKTRHYARAILQDKTAFPIDTNVIQAILGGKKPSKTEAAKLVSLANEFATLNKIETGAAGLQAAIFKSNSKHTEKYSPDTVRSALSGIQGRSSGYVPNFAKILIAAKYYDALKVGKAKGVSISKTGDVQNVGREVFGGIGFSTSRIGKGYASAVRSTSPTTSLKKASEQAGVTKSIIIPVVASSAVNDPVPENLKTNEALLQQFLANHPQPKEVVASLSQQGFNVKSILNSHSGSEIKSIIDILSSDLFNKKILAKSADELKDPRLVKFFAPGGVKARGPKGTYAFGSSIASMQQGEYASKTPGKHKSYPILVTGKSGPEISKPINAEEIFPGITNNKDPLFFSSVYKFGTRTLDTDNPEHMELLGRLGYSQQRLQQENLMAGGYIPNFSGLSDSISREKTMTGLPASQIMAHFDGKGKPIAVTNKKDEPNGLKDVVPNFAPRVRPPKAPKGSKKTTAAQGSDLFNSFFNELTVTGLLQSFLSTLTDREVINEDVNTVAQTSLPALLGTLQTIRAFKASKGQKFGAKVAATTVPIALGAAATGIGFAGSRSISEDLQRRKLEKESDRAAKEFKDLTEGTQELADTLSKLNESFKDASTSPEQLSSLSKRASELTRNLTKNNPGLAASISSESNVEKKINLIEDARRKASQQQAVKQEIIQFEGSKTKSPEDLINLFSKEISLANDKLLQLNSKDLVPANFDKILSDADLGPLKTFFDLQKQEVKNKLIPSFLEAVKSEIEYTKINKESVKKIKALRAEEFKASSEIEGKRVRRKAASDALASGAEELKPFASQFGPRAAISFDSDLQKTKESISAITSFRTQINTKLIDKDLKLPSNVTAKLQEIQTPGQDAGAVLAELSKTPGLNEKQIEALDELITTNQTQSKELKKISDISEINKNAQLRVLSIQEKLTYGGGIKTSTDARSRIDSINAPIRGLLESRLGATLGSERSQTSGMVNVLKSIKDLYPGLIENSKALGSVRDRLTNLRANDLRKDLFRNASLLESAGGYGDIPGMLRAKGLDSEGLKTLAATQAEAELSGGNSPQETTRYLADVIKAATDNLNATMREGQEIKALQATTAGPVEKINQETEAARQKFLTSLTESVKKAFGEKIDVQTVNITNANVNVNPVPTSQSGESSGAGQGQGSSAGKSKGFVPSFYNPLREAVQRESQYVPFSSIRVSKSNKLVNQNNPLGLGVTNTFDEPNGLASIGLASKGYVPNFAKKESEALSKPKIPVLSKLAGRLLTNVVVPAGYGTKDKIKTIKDAGFKNVVTAFKNDKPITEVANRTVPVDPITGVNVEARNPLFRWMFGLESQTDWKKFYVKNSDGSVSYNRGTPQGMNLLLEAANQAVAARTDFLKDGIELPADKNSVMGKFNYSFDNQKMKFSDRWDFGLHDHEEPLSFKQIASKIKKGGFNLKSITEVLQDSRVSKNLRQLVGFFVKPPLITGELSIDELYKLSKSPIVKESGGAFANLESLGQRAAKTPKGLITESQAFWKTLGLDKPTAKPKIGASQLIEDLNSSESLSNMLSRTKKGDFKILTPKERARINSTSSMPFPDFVGAYEVDKKSVFLDPDELKSGKKRAINLATHEYGHKALDSKKGLSSKLASLSDDLDKSLSSDQKAKLVKKFKGQDSYGGLIKAGYAPSAILEELIASNGLSKSFRKNVLENLRSSSLAPEKLAELEDLLSDRTAKTLGNLRTKLQEAAESGLRERGFIKPSLLEKLGGDLNKFGPGVSDLRMKIGAGLSGLPGKVKGGLGDMAAGLSGLPGKVKGGLGDMAAGLSGSSGRVKGGFSGGLAALGFFGNLQQSTEDSQAGRNLEENLSTLAAASATPALASGLGDLILGKSKVPSKFETLMGKISPKGLQAASAFSAAAESAREFRDGNKIAGTAKAAEAAAYAASIFEKGGGKGLFGGGGLGYGIGSGIGLGVEIAKAKNYSIAEDYSDILFGKKDENIDPETGEVTKSRSILGAGFDVFGTVMGAVAGGPIGKAVTVAKVGYRIGNVLENKTGFGEWLAKMYENTVNKERAGEIAGAEGRLRTAKPAFKDREAFKANIARIEEEGKKGVEEEKIKGAKALAEVYGGDLANKEKNDKEKTAPLRKGIIDGIIKNQEANGLVTSRDKANYLMSQEAIYGKFKPEEFADKELYKSYEAYSKQRDAVKAKEEEFNSQLTNPKSQAYKIDQFRAEAERQSSLLASAPKDALEEAMRRGIPVEQVMEERKNKVGKSRGFIPNFSNAYNREKLDILRNPDYSGYRNAVPQPSKYYKNIVKNSAEIEVPAVEVYNRMGYFGATPKNSSEQYAILNPAQQSKLGYASGGFVPNFAAEQFAGAVSDAMQKALSPLIDKVGTSVSNSNVINVSDQRSYQTGSDRITGIMEFLYSQFPKEMGRQMGPKLV